MLFSGFCTNKIFGVQDSLFILTFLSSVPVINIYFKSLYFTSGYFLPSRRRIFLFYFIKNFICIEYKLLLAFKKLMDYMVLGKDQATL